MTQPTDTTPTTTETHTETGTDTDAQPAGTESEQEPSPNSEAARWRTKLRETETQRDSLAERLTGYQRRECEPAVAELLDEPGDLWDIGQANVSEFYGALDEERLRAAAAALCEMRPKLAKNRQARVIRTSASSHRRHHHLRSGGNRSSAARMGGDAGATVGPDRRHR